MVNYDYTGVEPDSIPILKDLAARADALEAAITVLKAAPPPVGTDLVQKSVVHYESGLVITYERALTP